MSSLLQQTEAILEEKSMMFKKNFRVSPVSPYGAVGAGALELGEQVLLPLGPFSAFVTWVSSRFPDIPAS